VKGVRIPSVAHSDIDANLRRRREMYKAKMLIMSLRFAYTYSLHNFNIEFF
jgi:hypothetical protein